MLPRMLLNTPPSLPSPPQPLHTTYHLPNLSILPASHLFFLGSSMFPNILLTTPLNPYMLLATSPTHLLSHLPVSFFFWDPNIPPYTTCYTPSTPQPLHATYYLPNLYLSQLPAFFFFWNPQYSPIYYLLHPLHSSTPDASYNLLYS